MKRSKADSGSIPIYWDNLTKKNQSEILEAFGDNCNYDVFPIAEISLEDEMDITKCNDSQSKKTLKHIGKVVE